MELGEAGPEGRGTRLGPTEGAGGGQAGGQGPAKQAGDQKRARQRNVLRAQGQGGARGAKAGGAYSSSEA